MRFVARLATVAGVLALVGHLACTGDDGPPVCPTGNCTLAGSTVVKWKFNNYPEWMFDSDTCLEIGSFTVRVQVVNKDDPNLFDVLEKGCPDGQLTFVGLAPGSYNVAVTPLDGDGNSLVKAAVTGETLAGTEGANTEVTVKIPYTALLRAYTGQFLFRLAFNGMSCPAGVVQQVLLLTVGGQPVTQTTDTGQLLNGIDAKPCRALTEQFPQYVQGLPFGPAKLKVQGTGASANNVLYEKEFDTFIGAGTSNPTITFNVPVDAGVDAM